MKKTKFVFLAFVIFYIGNTYGQIVSIPDTNFENFLIQNNIDTDNQINGQILLADALAVDSLESISDSISDFTGLESFKNLVHLSIWFSDCNYIDVSQMDSLKSLLLRHTEITAIDLSNNSALSFLVIHSSPILNIDLSNNLNLESINLQDVDLTTIDVSNNTNLKQVILFHFENGCDSLDFSSNVNLDLLYVEGIGLTSLDLSTNPLIHAFHCKENPITELNIKNGNNTSIGGFSLVNNHDLTCIEVDDANYSTLNWLNIDPQNFFSENCNVPANVELEERLSIKVFPNPVTSTLNVETELDNYSLVIKSVEGKTVMISANQLFYDISHLESGIYVVSIYAGTNTFSKKIIIR